MTLPGRGARRSGPKAPARPHMAAGRGAGSGDCRGRPASVPASPPPSHPLRRRLAPRARGLPAGGLGFALFLPLFLTGQAGPGGGISDLLRAPVPCARVPGAARAGCPVPSTPRERAERRDRSSPGPGGSVVFERASGAIIPRENSTSCF